MTPSPRTFTRHELASGITNAQYWAMPEADRRAFDLALFALWESNYNRTADYIAGDYDPVGSNRRFEIGE